MPNTILWKIVVGVSIALIASTGSSHSYKQKWLLAYEDNKPISRHAAAVGMQGEPEKAYHKVWSIIKEDYYDQKFNGQSWSYWEHRYDGKLKNLQDAHKAIETMLASLSDRYTRFLDKEAFSDERDQIDAHLFGVGIQIGLDKTQKIIVIAPIEDTPASRAGLMPGDEIAEINGKATKGFSVEEAAKQIKGPKDTPVTLYINRPGQHLKVTMKRAEIHLSSIQTAKMLDSEIGYIRLTSFISQQANEEMKKALVRLSNAKGLIVDLRDNPGGLLSNAIDISNMFLDRQNTIVSTVDKDNYKSQALSDGNMLSKQPLAILINKGSASASEIASGALKDNGRAILVGEQTFGKGLVQGITKLEDGSGINVTIARYLTPNDTDINKKGITPDIIVKLTEKDIDDGKGQWWSDPAGPKAKRTPEDLKDIQLKSAYDTVKEKVQSTVLIGHANTLNSTSSKP
jgi:carboxyl-terminal processing protease